MTIQQQLEQAQQVWSKWRHLSIQTRVEILKPVVVHLPIQCQQLAKWLMSQAVEQLSEPRYLLGPTGEQNQLQMAGRGVFLIIEQSGRLEALIGQMMAAIISGNCIVVVTSDHERWAYKFAQVCPNAVIQVVDPFYLESLLCLPQLAGVALSGGDAVAINRLLAESEGQIATLVIEQDIEQFSTIAHPSYLSHFCD